MKGKKVWEARDSDPSVPSPVFQSVLTLYMLLVLE